MCFFSLFRQFASIAHSLASTGDLCACVIEPGPQNTFVVSSLTQSVCVRVCTANGCSHMFARIVELKLSDFNHLVVRIRHEPNKRSTDNSNNHTDAKVSISHFVRNSMIRLRTILFATATQPHSIRFCRRSVRGRREESVSIVQITMTTHHQHKAYTLYPAHHGVLFARCSDLAIYIVIFFCFLCFVAASKLSMCHHHFHHHHSHQRNCRTYFIVLYQLIIRSSNESIRLYVCTHTRLTAGFRIDK